MDTLLSVVTVSEAARMYEKNVRSVRRAIESRHKPLEARQSGGDWIITVESLRRRYRSFLLSTASTQTSVFSATSFFYEPLHFTNAKTPPILYVSHFVRHNRRQLAVVHNIKQPGSSSYNGMLRVTTSCKRVRRRVTNDIHFWHRHA